MLVCVICLIFKRMLLFTIEVVPYLKMLQTFDTFLYFTKS